MLIVDDFQGYIDPSKERFETVALEKLRLPNLNSVCFKYNVTELATAVKASFLRYLIEERGVKTVLYLDPDILVTDSLQPLFDALRSGPLVLTPHLDSDYPDDGFFPKDENILVSGIFNLGFLGIAAGDWSAVFLSWLENKLLTNCVIDHARGYFVDQRFFDLALAIFPEIQIERNIGYNVAYWNLHSRNLSREGNKWLCNGERLRFFHFSDYKLNRPDVISGHMNRYRVSERADIAPLFEDYRKRLLRQGYEEVSRWPYGLAYFRDGSVISDAVRREFRKTTLTHNPGDDPFSSFAWSHRRSQLATKAKIDRWFENIRSRAWRIAGRLSKSLKTVGVLKFKRL